MTSQKVSGGVNGKKNGAGAGKILFKACHKNISGKCAENDCAKA